MSSLDIPEREVVLLIGWKLLDKVVRWSLGVLRCAQKLYNEALVMGGKCGLKMGTDAGLVKA
jgi:hypothetical protein